MWANHLHSQPQALQRNIVRVLGLPIPLALRLNLGHTSSFRRQSSNGSHKCWANARDGEATTDS